MEKCHLLSTLHPWLWNALLFLGSRRPVPAPALTEPKEEAGDTDRGQAGRGMLTVRVSPSCSHGAPPGSLALAGGVLTPWE